MKSLRFEHSCYLTDGDVSEIVVMFLKEWNTCSFQHLGEQPFISFHPYNDEFVHTIADNLPAHF